MPKLIDAHTHAETDDIIKRALNAGIWLVNVGTDKESSAKAVELAQKYSEGVYTSVGLHPNEVEKEKLDYDFYKNLAQNPKVVAIGECGLDYHRNKQQETRNKQQEIFIRHIELAKELKKPLMIHCRNAFHDLVPLLKSYILNLKSPGIIHFFSGTKDDAKKLMDLEFSFSFGGVITFTRDYDEVIKYIPLENIVLETDAPYVAPVPYRGKKNEPLYITETAKKLAELKNESFEKIAEITTKNAQKIFRI